MRRTLHLLGAVAMVAAVAAGAFWFLLDPPLAEYERQEALHERLREEYLATTRQALNADLLRRQLAELEEMGRQVAIRLPDADAPALGWKETEASIRAAAKGTALVASLEVAAGDEVQSDYSVHRPYSVRATGEFKEVVTFLHRVSSASEQLRLLRQASVQRRAPGGSVTLTAEVLAIGYRGDASIAAQRARGMLNGKEQAR